MKTKSQLLLNLSRDTNKCHTVSSNELEKNTEFSNVGIHDK